MLYAILCFDKPDCAHKRAETRNAHLAYLAALGDRLLEAGPLLDDGEKTPIGSLLIIDFADRAQAQSFVAADPYTQAGLFAQTRIHRYRRVFPQPRE